MLNGMIQCANNEDIMIELLLILTVIVTVGLSTIIVLLLFQTPQNVEVKKIFGLIFFASLILMFVGLVFGLGIAENLKL